MKWILIISYVVALIYGGRDSYALLKSKGKDIRFSKWTRKFRNKPSYYEIIAFHVIGLFLLGLSMLNLFIILDDYTVSKSLSDQSIYMLFIGLILTISAGMFFLQAQNSKYILYFKNKFPDVKL